MMDYTGPAMQQSYLQKQIAELQAQQQKSAAPTPNGLELVSANMPQAPQPPAMRDQIQHLYELVNSQNQRLSMLEEGLTKLAQALSEQVGLRF